MQNVDNRIDLRIDLAQTSKAAFDRLAASDLACANRAGKLAGAPSPQRGGLCPIPRGQGPNGFSRSSRALASFATLKSNSCSRVTFFSTKLKYLLLQKSCMAMMESTGGITSSLR